MKFKYNFLFSLFIMCALANEAIAAEAGTTPKNIINEAFSSITQIKGDPTAEQIQKANDLLIKHIDGNVLGNKLFTDLPVTLTDSQKEELLKQVELQLTSSLIKALQKNESNKLPETKEITSENGINLLYTQQTPKGPKEINMVFGLVEKEYLLQDITVGKRSLLTVYQRQFKKLFKKATYEQVLEQLKKGPVAESENAATP